MGAGASTLGRRRRNPRSSSRVACSRMLRRDDGAGSFGDNWSGHTRSRRGCWRAFRLAADDQAELYQLAADYRGRVNGGEAGLELCTKAVTILSGLPPSVDLIRALRTRAGLLRDASRWLQGEADIEEAIKVNQVVGDVRQQRRLLDQTVEISGRPPQPGGRSSTGRTTRRTAGGEPRRSRWPLGGPPSARAYLRRARTDARGHDPLLLVTQQAAMKS